METHNLTLATVNFMTPKYIEILYKSMRKANAWYKADIQVYDNGPTKTLSAGQHNGYYVHYIDDSLYDNFDKMPIVDAPGWRNYASAKHAKTLQYIIDSTTTKFLMLLDSDIVFTDSFERLFHIFSRSNTVMCGYIKKPTGFSDRIAPWCTLLNVQLLRKLGVKYYDESRMLYVNGNKTDDTGASILSDCRRLNYPIIELPKDNMFYFHFKGGSYSDPRVVNTWFMKLSQYWN